jgi:hypothetical protein
MRAGNRHYERIVDVPHQTNTLTENPRKPKDDVNCWLESSHELNLPISVPILVKRVCLLTKNAEYRFGRVAVFQSGSERVDRKVHSGLLAIFF